MKEVDNQDKQIEAKAPSNQHKLRRYQSRYANNSDGLPKGTHYVFYSGPYISTGGEIFHGVHVDGVRFIKDKE